MTEYKYLFNFTNDFVSKIVSPSGHCTQTGITEEEKKNEKHEQIISVILVLLICIDLSASQG